MKSILVISVGVIVVGGAFLCGVFVENMDEPIDPRSPPADVQPGRYSHQTTKTESWSNLPLVSKENGGTEAASIQRPTPKRLTTDRTDTSVPERSDPPPAAYIGERVPFWYEHQREPGEGYEAPPTPARRGLFRNLFRGRTA